MSLPVGVRGRGDLSPRQGCGSFRSEKYLATRVGVPIAGGTPADAIAFNNARADQELKFFGQENIRALRDIRRITNAPMGFTFGDPLGIRFMGTAFSEPTLIKLASGFENVVQARRPPQFLSTAARYQWR